MTVLVVWLIEHCEIDSLLKLLGLLIFVYRSWSYET